MANQGPSTGFKVDDKALAQFAKDMAALAGTISGLAGSAPSLSVDFGQGLATYNNFADADKLFANYTKQCKSLVMGGGSSLSHLAALITTLADAAAQLAKQYADARDQDVVGVDQINNLLNTINPSTTTLPS